MTEFTADEFSDMALKILIHEQYIEEVKGKYRMTEKGKIVTREIFHI